MKKKVFSIILIIMTLIASCVTLVACDIKFTDAVKPSAMQSSDNEFVYEGIIADSIQAVITVRGGYISNGKFSELTFANGFIISADGYILTSKTVLSKTRIFQAEVMMPNGEIAVYTAEIIKQTVTNPDFVIMKIINNDPNTVFDYLEFAESNSVVYGEPCVVIGNSVGLGIFCVKGMVGSPSIPINKSYINVSEVMIVNATINAKNHGSPVINRNGKVIGVILGNYNAINLDSHDDIIYDTGYAVKADTIVAFLSNFSRGVAA